jgi:hypothetical protein
LLAWALFIALSVLLYTSESIARSRHSVDLPA